MVRIQPRRRRDGSKIRAGSGQQHHLKRNIDTNAPLRSIWQGMKENSPNGLVQVEKKEFEEIQPVRNFEKIWIDGVV